MDVDRQVRLIYGSRKCLEECNSLVIILLQPKKFRQFD